SPDGVKLSAPFRDHSSARTVLALSRGIRGAPGREIVGVVAIEMTYEYVATRLLARPEAAVRGTFLLDREGRLLVHSTKATNESRDGAGFLERFPVTSPVDANLVDDMVAGESGTRDGEWDGRRVLAAFYRLPVLGWTYVAVADAEMLEA